MTVMELVQEDNELAFEDVEAGSTPDTIPTRAEMLKHPNRDKFLDAEGVEIENMEKHDVLEWCTPPKGARLISSKFTYKRK
jgi:hypothetical protein